MKKTFIIFIILLCITACVSDKEYNTRTYHAVAAEGYAYYNNKPLPNTQMSVTNWFKSDGYFTKSSISESFTSDSAGYFRVRFIKRTMRDDLVKYSIWFDIDSLYYNTSNDTLSFGSHFNTSIQIPAEVVRNAKQNIQLGVLNLKQNKYYYYYRN